MKPAAIKRLIAELIQLGRDDAMSGSWDPRDAAEFRKHLRKRRAEILRKLIERTTREEPRCRHEKRAVPSDPTDLDLSHPECPDCHQPLGEWYCPESTTGKCEYAEDDVCRDTCLHCGQPAERK